MAAENKIVSVNLSSVKPGEVKKPSEAIAGRKSRELVIAFAGPVGCGINSVKGHVKATLENGGYTVHVIKISDYLLDCLKSKVINIEGEVAEGGAQRYFQMQDSGNALRRKQGDILAEYSIQKIRLIREQTSSGIDPGSVPSRVAYLIDQIKHPDEVNLLRAVYGNLFYLFGVLSTAARREARLKSEGVKPEELIAKLIERDKKQREKHGQQLDKTLLLADFFLRNDHANIESIEKQIKRFVDLIHGANGITPTLEEYGMYIAYAAGLRSACLSRQVGASIMNRQGSIISTGRNDVPQPGGGLYGPEHGSNDARCIKLEDAKCFNDLYKTNLKKDVGDVIKKGICDQIAEIRGGATPEQIELLDKVNPDKWASAISDSAYQDTRLGVLIEFSRSIHAEMDAIVSLARVGGGSTEGATLFTYTFPCHNCARHIVAAGITKVYFLEPYEKSLATDLHGDAIDVDGKSGGLGAVGAGTRERVQFLYFEGVAPRQYLNMFTPAGERKNNTGHAVTVNVRAAEKKVPEYLDDYRDYELKVLEHFNLVTKELEEGGVVV